MLGRGREEEKAGGGEAGAFMVDIRVMVLPLPGGPLRMKGFRSSSHAAKAAVCRTVSTVEMIRLLSATSSRRPKGKCDCQAQRICYYHAQHTYYFIHGKLLFSFEA